MNFNNLLLATFLSSALAANAEVAGNWVAHPAFDIYSYLYSSAYVSGFNQATNNVQRIVDGERYMYALVSGGLYENPEWNCSYSQVPFFVGRIDKQQEGAKMQPLNSQLQLSGLAVTAMEYSQAKKCLALGYDNGCFDFIFDDGRVASNSELKNMTQPGGRKMLSFSFTPDGNQAVIATEYGVIVADLETASILNRINFATRVDFANVINGFMIVSADGIFRVFPLFNPPAKLAEAPALKSSADLAPANLLSEGAVKSTFGIYPVTDNAFLYGGPVNAASGTGMSVNLLTLPENPLEEESRVTNICSATVNYKAMAGDPLVNPFFPNMSLFTPTKNGLMVHQESNVYLIDANGKSIDYSQPNAEKNYIAEVLTTIRKDVVAAADQQAGPERWKTFGSYDGETFWVFRPRHGFQQRQRTGTGTAATWANAGDIVEVNASGAGMPRDLYYSPKYGLVVCSDGRNHDFTNDYCQNDGLSSYKNGEWTIHTLAKTNLVPGWMYQANVRTQNYITGACPDPVLQDYVYARAETSGIRRQNLADPTQVLLLTRSTYAPKNTDRAVVTQTSTGSIYNLATVFSEFGFDNDGTLWTAYKRFPQTAYPDEHAELWYWTVEDRSQVLKGADYDAHPMKIINVPEIAGPMHGQVFPCRHEKNKNLIVHLAKNNEYDSYVYDHNGTPDDSSDDKWVVLKNMRDVNGDLVAKFDKPYDFVEDQETGVMGITTARGIAMVTRESLFDGETPVIEWLAPVRESDGSCISTFGSDLYGLNGITVDSENRKWTVSGNGLVTCLSPDMSTILAEFDPDNSPLPASTYMSIIYNPDTNSIFVGSYHGLMEFCLAGSATNPNLLHKPTVAPRVTDASYSGYINITGLNDGLEYALTGPDGETVTLPKPQDGRIQIHPQDYPRGTYTLEGHPEVEFIINR